MVNAKEMQKTLEKIVKLFLELNKATEIMVKELIAEAIEQHEEDYEHKEKMLTVEEIEQS